MTCPAQDCQIYIDRSDAYGLKETHMICVAFNTFREAYSGALEIDVGRSLYVIEAGERWFVCDWEGLRRVGQPLTRLQVMPGATNSTAWGAL